MRNLHVPSRSPVYAKNAMVATSHPEATLKALEIIKKGGNAVDASTAIGFALAVTLPRAGNLGGGGFMLIYDKNKGEISSIDYRSAAPAIAKSSEVVGKNGKTIRYGQKVSAVPGSVAGLLKAHSERGTLSLKEVMEPAIRLAEEGIEVTYDLNQALKLQLQRQLVKFFHEFHGFQKVVHPPSNEPYFPSIQFQQLLH